MVNSRLSRLLAPPSPTLLSEHKLLGAPFFQRYGVNLPSSLTEGVSFTWGAFSLPTGVGLRYGQSLVWLAAFLGGLGPHDFRTLAPTRASRHACCRTAFPVRRASVWQPLLSTREAHAPYRVPASLLTDQLWCRILPPALHRLRLNVLGLGPDSPWVDCRCPGTLRLSVWVVRTPMTLLIPAFALLCTPPVLAVRLLRPYNAPLPCPPHKREEGIPSFGAPLEPRYVVGAPTLDQ